MTSLRSQLAKLKQSAGAEDEPDDILRLLISIVASSHALFWPQRTPHWTALSALKNLPAIMERRKAYLSRTRGILAKAQGQREWKKSHYLRKLLIEKGYATATYTNGTLTSLFPTELGDTVAHAAIYGDVVFPLRTLVCFELLQRKPGMLFLDGPWRSESKLFGRELFGDPHDWVHLTELMLPLLVRGLARSHQDTHGRIFYGFVSADLPERITVSQKQVEWAHDHYISVFNSELASLESLVFEGGEIIIPLPASSFDNFLCSEDNSPTFEHGELAEFMKIATADPSLSFEQGVAAAKEELKNRAKTT